MRVAVVGGYLGLGGTDRGVVAMALALAEQGHQVRVITTHGGGPREQPLREAGIPFALGAGEEAAMATALEGAEVVHAVRHGIAEPLVPRAARRAGARALVETNIFGARDRSADEASFGCHLFISKMCLLRYRGWVGGGEAFDRRHRVLYLPQDGAALRALAPGREEACRELGLDPDRPVVGRIGRAADLKWRDLLIDMVPHLLRLVPEVQILLVGLTPAKRRRLERHGVLDRVRAIEPTADERRLLALHAACDVQVNASMIGESQGLSIAEGMALGRPAVTCSTPWADNAQIEFVENGVTGWVANHPREFAEAVADLLADDARRSRFGVAARERVDRALDPHASAVQLGELYAELADGAPAPSSWSPSAQEIERFSLAYPGLARASFRALSPAEHAQARWLRTRERAQRLLASGLLVAGGLLRRWRRGEGA